MRSAQFMSVRRASKSDHTSSSRLSFVILRPSLRRPPTAPAFVSSSSFTTSRPISRPSLRRPPLAPASVSSSSFTTSRPTTRPSFGLNTSPISSAAWRIADIEGNHTSRSIEVYQVEPIFLEEEDAPMDDPPPHRLPSRRRPSRPSRRRGRSRPHALSRTYPMYPSLFFVSLFAPTLSDYDPLQRARTPALC